MIFVQHCATMMALRCLRLGISRTSASVEIVMPRELSDSLALPYCSLSPQPAMPAAGRKQTSVHQFQCGSKPVSKMNSMNWLIYRLYPRTILGSTIGYAVGSCGCWLWGKEFVNRGEKGKEGGCLDCILNPESQGSRQGTVQAALLASTALQPSGKAGDTSYKRVMQTFRFWYFCQVTIIIFFSTSLNACTHQECMKELHLRAMGALQTHRNSSVQGIFESGAHMWAGRYKSPHGHDFESKQDYYNFWIMNMDEYGK